MNRGVLYAVSAYVLWGLFPIFIKSLSAARPTQILAHRMVWSLVFVALLLTVRRQWTWVRQVAHSLALLKLFVASATAITLNWGVFIWAINNHHVVDASLGYFMNPLVNVLLASLVLKERLRPGQWVAVGIAGSGVFWLTGLAGTPPWIGLALAVSFSVYGLLRKTAPFGALEGLTIETTLLFPFAAAYLVWLSSQGQNDFQNGSNALRLLLVISGPVTAIPLLLFAAGARRIPFTTLGLLQYIGPSIQLVIGVYLYHEPFDQQKLIGYIAIWIALAIYLLEGLYTAKKRGNST